MPVIRINDEELHKEVKEQARRHSQSVAQFTEEALQKLVDEKGYDYESLLELVKNSALLSLYIDTIKSELDGAPRPLIKDIVKLLKEDPNARFYKIYVDKKDTSKISEIFSAASGRIVMIAKISPRKEDSLEADEIVGLIAKAENEHVKKEKTDKIREMNIKMSLKKDVNVKDKPELLIFASYKNEGDGSRVKKEGEEERSKK